MAYRIKGWTKFQHFKDRRPPWIKLYRDLLEDPDWHDLDGDTAKVLVALWLLASEDEDQEGKLPDSRRLAFRLRMSETKVTQALSKLSHWLEHDDIDWISDGYQDDAPETDKRQIKETDKRQSNSGVPKPTGVSDQVWADFLAHRKTKKASVTNTVIAQIVEQAELADWPLEKALQEMCVRGWTGFNAEWVNKSNGGKTRPHTKEDFDKIDYGTGIRKI